MSDLQNAQEWLKDARRNGTAEDIREAEDECFLQRQVEHRMAKPRVPPMPRPRLTDLDDARDEADAQRRHDREHRHDDDEDDEPWTI